MKGLHSNKQKQTIKRSRGNRLHGTLRHRAGDNSESEIWRLDIRLEILSIGYVENSDARGVPGTTSQETLARRFIMVTIVVINIWVLAVVSAMRAGNFTIDNVARDYGKHRQAAEAKFAQPKPLRRHSLARF